MLSNFERQLQQVLPVCGSLWVGVDGSKGVVWHLSGAVPDELEWQLKLVLPRPSR